MGSEFIITIALELRAEKGAPARSVETKPTNPKPQTPHGKILIVDDAEDNRTLIQLYLERLGFDSDSASTGRQAVGLALHNPYDLILMDVQMPEMDGFEAVSELRSQNYAGPIVALTAHTMKGDRERCLEGGFDDYLGKPIDRELLKKSLNKFTSH